jgi:hypothetical protein
MSKLPNRKVLRGILADAISDREGMNNPETNAETRATISKYRLLQEKLEIPSSIITEKDKDTLALACFHARIWRESYYDAWSGTGEKEILHTIRNDIAKLDRVERSIGRRIRHVYEALIENAQCVSINELRQNRPA